MRNLKRALSLTLASVMLLGMMVVGTSAAGFPDVDDEDNVEAIEVLQAVGIMVGDAETGNFRPDSPVSRAEMAVVMAILQNLTTSYYVSTCPFTDVSGSYDWARGPVGACYATGVISGRSATTFDPGATVTAVEAAAMMLRALGYFKYTEDYADGFNLSIVRQANQIGLFEGIEGDATTALTRNQVAKLTLNALQANLVDFTGTPGIEVNGVKVGYKAEYTFRSGTDPKYRAISNLGNNDNTTGTNQSYVQLGEERYDGDLRLYSDETDDFGRPARHWEYDGEEIGTYAKYELLRREYTVKVTGKDLYDQLGSSVVNNIGGTGNNAWTLYSYIDGEDATLEKADISRSNTDGVLETGKGVLTQVFEDTSSKEISVVVVNTFLAIADEDYDEKNGEVDLTVYALANTGSNKNPVYGKNKEENGLSVTVEDEDIDVSGVKEDDMFLVTVAKGKVQSMTAPEVLSGREISSFKKTSDVVSEGQTYEYGDTAKYDVEVLEAYSQTNLKDTTYNIILDKYGYLIGLEQNEDADQYVFLTGLDGNYSYLSNRDSDANIIHLDGTMETVTVNMKDSAPIVNSASVKGGDWTDPAGDGHGAGKVSDDRNYSQINTWCTYSVDSKGVYTLKEVGTTFPTRGAKVAQATQDAGDATGDEVEINVKNVSLDNAAGDGKVYGNNDTVYINVSLEDVRTKETTTPWYQVIDDVESVTVGVRNAGLKITDLGSAGDGEAKGTAFEPANEIYTLYKDNGYIIAAVVIGEDDGLSKTYAYIHSDDVKRERYDKEKDEWTWVREAIVNGKIVDLTEVGGGTALSELEAVEQNNWYEIKTNADGNVTDAKLIDPHDVEKGGTACEHGTKHSASDGDAANADDYIFCANTDHFGAANDYPKFVGNVELVRGANLDNDQVILFQKDFVAPEDEDDDTIEYKNGTLYVNTDKIKGFDVSPDVRTVLCLSDGAGEDFDDVIDTYTGYSGLERAIKNLDSNFTGDLSVVFEKGSAVVIIFNDTTDAEAGGDDDDGPDGAQIVGNEAVNTDDPDNVTLDIYVYGGSTAGNEGIKKYLENKFGGTAKRSNGKWSFGDDSDSYANVTVTEVQVWKVSMATPWKDASSDGTDKDLITAATVDNATLKVGNTVYVKATDTVDLKVTVGTLTVNTTLTFQVSNGSASLAASTKALGKDTAGDHDTTVSVTSGALTNITKDIELNVKVTDT